MKEQLEKATQDFLPDKA